MNTNDKLSAAVCSAFLWNGRPLRVFNPHGKPLDELPVIIGFNNGGGGISNMLHAVAISQDGVGLADHVCSDEGFMLHDLSMIEGADWKLRQFINYYPDGFRCKFVGSNTSDPLLAKALSLQASNRRGLRSDYRPISDNCRDWYYYPVAMPVTKDGDGPAFYRDADRVVYEVWDRLLNSHSRHKYMCDAINEAMRLERLRNESEAQAGSE